MMSRGAIQINAALNRKELGKILQKIRESRDLRQRDVATLFELSEASISKMECGNLSISLSRLLQFCNLYKVHPGKVLDVFYSYSDEYPDDERVLVPSQERKELHNLINSCSDNRVHDILTITSALLNDDAK